MPRPKNDLTICIALSALNAVVKMASMINKDQMELTGDELGCLLSLIHTEIEEGLEEPLHRADAA